MVYTIAEVAAAPSDVVLKYLQECVAHIGAGDYTPDLLGIHKAEADAMMGARSRIARASGGSVYGTYALTMAQAQVAKARMWLNGLVTRGVGGSPYEVSRILWACQDAVALVTQAKVGGEVVYTDDGFRGGVEWFSHKREGAYARGLRQEQAWQVDLWGGDGYGGI